MTTGYDEMAVKIAGNVVVSPNPGQALKAWRQRLRIKQVSLASKMGVSPSVLSDYESGRRASPGVAFVRRYIEALIHLDQIQNRLLEGWKEFPDRSAILSIGEFHRPVKARHILKMVEGDLLTGEDLQESHIFGYTILDSIKTIYALSGFDFYRIFGATTERVLVFTKVGLGRSPLVAIRVSQLKPRMVILHGPKVVDRLAIELARKERIILALSTLKNEEAFTQILTKL